MNCNARDLGSGYMADNLLELVVELDAHKTKVSIKSVNARLLSRQARLPRACEERRMGLRGTKWVIVAGAQPVLAVTTTAPSARVSKPMVIPLPAFSPAFRALFESPALLLLRGGPRTRIQCRCRIEWLRARIRARLPSRRTRAWMWNRRWNPAQRAPTRF